LEGKGKLQPARFHGEDGGWFFDAKRGELDGKALEESPYEPETSAPLARAGKEVSGGKIK